MKMIMAHFKARIKEVGSDRILTPELIGDYTREYAEKFWGVHDPDVEWFEIEEIMDRKESIEIPFGAKDSELKGWEYTIPKGMEAEIKDGKIIVRKKESEDERIRKHLIGVVELYYGNTDEQEKKDCLAWLEKQGDHRAMSKPKKSL